MIASEAGNLAVVPDPAMRSDVIDDQPSAYSVVVPSVSLPRVVALKVVRTRTLPPNSTDVPTQQILRARPAERAAAG